MFAGHVGIALGLRRVTWAPPLWVLVLAAQLPDWGDAVFEFLRVHPADPGWSPHGFPLLAAGAVATGILGVWFARSWRGGALPVLACLSHWATDYVTGWKPTWPGGPRNIGLGWYEHPPRDFVLEAAVVLVGWWLWRGSLPVPDPAVLARPRPRRHAGLDWALLAVLLALQAGVDLVLMGHRIIGG